MRLAKLLARSGLASRRAAEEIVRAGRVTVAGETVEDPARDVSALDDVRVDGEPLTEVSERLVYVLHKPEGVVSTAHDPQGRPTVVALLDHPARLYPVGRLDLGSTGLILLTNDGELAYRLTHPRFEVPKTYLVTVSGRPVEERDLRRLREGVPLEDGMSAPAEVVRRGPRTLEITIHEGRKRQVRRMCEAVGHPVRSLQRVSFGPLALGDLKPGEHRRLTEAEISRLRAATGGFR
jgi:23S rRNA pseudouridine2605 synthase